MSEKTITIKQTRSTIGRHKSHGATMAGLGLNKIGRTNTLEDTPSVRGMINKVCYAVEIVTESK